MDATELTLMRRYELSVAGFDPHTPELEHRFRTELARRGWARRIIRGSREPPYWRNDCPRDVQDWLSEFQELSGFSSHEVGAMIRADSDMRNKQFRIFIDEIQLLGSDDSSEIEYQYLKACAVRLIPPRDVKLESEDERAVSRDIGKENRHLRTVASTALRALCRLHGSRRAKLPGRGLR
jgi:hypothetical protein